MRSLSKLTNISNTAVSCSTCSIQSKLNANTVNTQSRTNSNTQSIPLLDDTLDLKFITATVTSSAFLGLFSQSHAKENIDSDMKAAQKLITNENNTVSTHKAVKRLNGKGHHISKLTLDERIKAARQLEESDNFINRPTGISLRS